MNVIMPLFICIYFSSFIIKHKSAKYCNIHVISLVSKCIIRQRAPANGQVQCSDENYFRSTCRFSCNSDYVLRGRSSVSCGLSKRWSASTPICQAITCPRNVNAPGDGSMIPPSSYTLRSVMQFTCDQGYFLRGSSTSRCMDVDRDGAGEWSDPPPICEEITCPSIEDFTNGIMLSPSRSWGSAASFACHEGYYLHGNDTLQCVDTNDNGVGEWSGIAPTCVEITCPEPPRPDNGQFTNSPQTNYGTIMTIACDEGYFLVGQFDIECTDLNNDGIGDWNGTFPICQVITCPVLTPPDNALFVSFDSFGFGSTLTTDCTAGYFLIGNSVLLCMDTNDDGAGEWNSSLPICQQILCPGGLDAPVNGNMVRTSPPSWGSTLSFTCDEGFFLDGDDELLCEDVDDDGLGEWNGQPPLCRLIKCIELPPPQNGEYVVSNAQFAIGTELRITCNVGYHEIMDDPLTCVGDNSRLIAGWVGILPTCQLIQCIDLPPPSNGIYVTSQTLLSVGTNLSINCDEGYHEVNHDIVTCTDNNATIGEWTGFLPICQRTECELLSIPVSGDVLCTESNFVGSTCVFTCVYGHHLVGSNFTECVDGDEHGVGRWVYPYPICEEIRCTPPLAIPINGSLSCNDSNRLDSQCHFACELGFFLSGNDITTCEDDGDDGIGEWSNEQASCEQITCEPQRSPVHGQISCSDGSMYGSRCFFECANGYSLVGFDQTLCGEPALGITGRWTGEQDFPPICESNTCGPSSADPQNGTHRCSDGNRYQSECRYQCALGYRLNGSPSRRCQSDNSWSEPEPICDILRCRPAPSNPENGLVFCTDGDRHGSTCNFFCDLGYELIGSPVTRCSRDTNDDGFGEFENPSAFCEAIYCTDIEGLVEGGSVVCGLKSVGREGNRYGSECVLSCQDGWATQGEHRTFCAGTGSWTATLGACIRYSCVPPLLTPVFGAKLCSTHDDAIGTLCSFTCEAGSRLLGSNLAVTCLNDGSWSGPPPICIRG